MKTRGVAQAKTGGSTHLKHKNSRKLRLAVALGLDTYSLGECWEWLKDSVKLKREYDVYLNIYQFCWSFQRINLWFCWFSILFIRTLHYFLPSACFRFSLLIFLDPEDVQVIVLQSFFSFFLFLRGERVLGIVPRGAEAGFELSIVLPQPPESLNRYAPPHPIILLFQHRHLQL